MFFFRKSSLFKTYVSMILPTYPGKIPHTSPNLHKERTFKILHKLLVKQWNIWGIFQGVCGWDLRYKGPQATPPKKTPKDLPSLRKSWVLEKKQTQRAEELVVGARSTSTNLPGWNLGFLVGNLPTLKLTACPWKWMVGRWVSFWDPSYFQGRTVSFREGRGL